MTAARGLALAAAERVVDGVHRDPADVGPAPEPALAARLAQRHVLVIDVADLADGGHALLQNPADLARRQPDRHVVALLGHELHARPRAAGELAALARLELHVVHLGAERNVLEGQGVAGKDVDAVSRDDGSVHGHAGRVQDVPLLAVGVGHERNARGPVRVVLDGRHPPRHVALVALEVDDAIRALVPAAPLPNRDAAPVVAAAGLGQRLGQGLVRLRLGDLVESLHRLEAPPRRRRLVLAYGHRPATRLPGTRARSRRRAAGCRPSSSPDAGPRNAPVA